MELPEYQTKLSELLQAVVKGVRVGIKMGEDPEDIDAAMSRIWPHVRAVRWYDETNYEHIALFGEAMRLFGEDPEKYIDPDTLVMPDDTIN